MSMSVCVCLSGNILAQSSPNIRIMSVAYGRGSVLLWRRCNTLCTSGFMGNVMFSHSGPEAYRRHVK